MSIKIALLEGTRRPLDKQRTKFRAAEGSTGHMAAVPQAWTIPAGNVIACRQCPLGLGRRLVRHRGPSVPAWSGRPPGTCRSGRRRDFPRRSAASSGKPSGITVPSGCPQALRHSDLIRSCSAIRVTLPKNPFALPIHCGTTVPNSDR